MATSKATFASPEATVRPAVRIAVGREDRPALGDFSPLAPPRDLRVSLADLSPSLLERLRAGIVVHLRAGEYRLSVLEDEPLPATVPEDCRCDVVLAAGRPGDTEGDVPMVTSAELSFSRPIVLGNILAILARLQGRFSDYEITELLNRVAQTISDKTGIADLKSAGAFVASRLLRRLGSWLPLTTRQEETLEQIRAAFGVSVQRAATVRLRRVSAAPVRRGGRWQLELRFTGEWDFMGQVSIPFHHVRVHRAILPSPHALLENLLSTQPLATAALRPSARPAMELAQQLGAMVESLRGRATVRAGSPDLALAIHMADDGELTLDTSGHEFVEAHASFHGEAAPDRLQLGLDRFELHVGPERLAAHGTFAGWTPTPPRDDPADTAMGRAMESLYTGEWASTKLAFRLELSVEEGSRLGGFRARARYQHPLLQGDTFLAVALDELALHGTAAVTFGSSAGPRPSHELDLRVACALDVEPGSRVEGGRDRLLPTVSNARVEGTIQSAGPQTVTVRLAGQAETELQAHARIEAFPELNIEAGDVEVSVGAGVTFDVALQTRELGRAPVEADFSGTRVELDLRHATARLGERELSLPEGSRLSAGLADARLATSGLGRARIDLAFDLAGRSPVLTHPGGAVELFVPPLRQGDMTLHISPAGGLTITGPERGLYDARYFNALLNPADEPRRILDIFGSDEALDRVFDTVAVFSPDAVRLLERLRNFVRRARRILDEEHVREPADAIPAKRIAHLAARLLFDEAGLAQQLYPIVLRVVDGKGLDIPAVKRLVAEQFPNHELEFELDRLLRLADRVLGPTAPVEPQPIRRVVALAEDPAYLESYAEVPSANEMYAAVEAAEKPTSRLSARIAWAAPYLRLDQVDYLLRRKDWHPQDLARLRHTRELKHRVSLIASGYGGVAYAPQATAISFFLADTIRASRLDTGAGRRPLFHREPPLAGCLLGPEDVAVLLQAGLATAWASRTVQLNQRMLLELVLEQPEFFLRDVLLELGKDDPRVLTGALNALLGMPQDAMRAPLDLPGVFSQRFGFEFPRVEDFLAGGRRARHSYYEALSNTADQILSLANPYRALKFRLREYRHPVPVLPRLKGDHRRPLDAALAAIEAADRAGRACTFSAREQVRQAQARKAYQRAFDACAALLREDPRAFARAPIKAFWGRNHEALVVLSVLRNIQAGDDAVARWFEVRSGGSVPADEQPLLDGVIDVLYFDAADRRRLKKDPLVRLLIDPPPGHYDFTVVSCMGVITGGARGTELEEAYRRLEERRGIRVIRADTATGRDLKFNAARIIEAIRETQTPWGYIGYSQGCANGLMAESLLMAGTPDERRLLDGLVCRNLLFSAFNGSAHGNCSDEKFLASMVYLDHFLAHYQAHFSSRAIQSALRAIRLALDSRSWVLGLLGSRSVSVWGVLGLHRGGQFKADVPTSLVRGVVEPETLPEALQWLSNVLTRQLEADNHDTQVTTQEAQGHSILVESPQTRILKQCDMGCLVQRTHHWSPLKKDTQFVTTQRDRDLAIYDYPKDRHVFPWIEVNARFGRIRGKR